MAILIMNTLSKFMIVILQSIGIIEIKSKEKRVVTYTPADILVGIE